MIAALLPMSGPQALGERLLDLLTSPGLVLVAFLVALAAGAAHAVGPGHGTSLSAAHLVGREGRVRDAAWTARSVAVVQTLHRGAAAAWLTHVSLGRTRVALLT